MQDKCKNTCTRSNSIFHVLLSLQSYCRMLSSNTFSPRIPLQPITLPLHINSFSLSSITPQSRLSIFVPLGSMIEILGSLQLRTYLKCYSIHTWISCTIYHSININRTKSLAKINAAKCISSLALQGCALHSSPMYQFRSGPIKY